MDAPPGVDPSPTRTRVLEDGLTAASIEGQHQFVETITIAITVPSQAVSVGLATGSDGSGAR